MNREIIEGDGGRRLAAAAIILIGFVLLVLPSYHFFSEEEPLRVVLVGVVPPILLAVVVIYAGLAVFWSDIGGPEAWRMTLWVLTGSAFFGAGAYLQSLYQVMQGVQLVSPYFSVTNTVTGGAAVGLLIGYYDLRSRRESVALAREKEKLNALFENVGAPSVMLEFSDDSDLTIVRVNSMFEEVFGQTSGEMVGHRLRDLPVPPAEQVLEDIDSEVCKQRPCVREVEYSAPTQTLYFLVQITPFRVRDGEGAFLSYVDITGDKIQQQRLSVMNRVLRHDLRNKVNVVMGNAEILRDRVSPEERENVDAILGKADELVSLSDRVGLLEKGHEGPFPVNLSDDVGAIVDRFRQDRPAVEVTTELPDEFWVRGGPLLDLVIESLLENAVEHSDLPEDEVEIGVELDEEPHDVAVLRIRDNGPGMPEEVLEVLDTGEESALYHSEGIGLWIVKWILNTLSGDLEFEENEPRGTVAVVRLNTADRSVEAEK